MTLGADGKAVCLDAQAIPGLAQLWLYHWLNCLQDDLIKAKVVSLVKTMIKQGQLIILHDFSQITIKGRFVDKKQTNNNDDNSSNGTVILSC